MKTSPFIRFWRYVDIDAGGCWLWRGALTRTGYSLFTGVDRLMPAHRFSFMAFVGPIEDGLHIDHLCRNRACVNPAHMEPVTPRQNVLRGVSFAAKNAKKTHCLNGHLLSADNIVRQSGRRSGHRKCKACQRNQNLRDSLRRKLVA